MSHDNPYAAPTVVEEAAPPSAAGWRMDGSGVLVKSGTVLPPVDLETGLCAADGEELVPVVRRSAAGLNWSVAMVAVIVFWLVLRDDGRTFTLLPWLLLGYLILGTVGPFKRKVLAIWEHHGKRRVAARRRRMWFRLALLAAGPLVVYMAFQIAAISGFNGMPGLLLGSLAVCLVLLVLALVLGFADRSRTTLVDAGDGWLRLDGLHPDAVTAMFNLEQAERMAIHTSGGERTWSVHSVFGQRFPFSFLIDRETGPWLALNLFILRLVRSRRLEMTLLAPDEAEEVPAETLHPALRDEIAAWRERHPRWSLLRAERSAASFCVIEQEFAVLADEERRQVAMLIVTRAKSSPVPVRCRLQMHAWKSDGHLIATTDQPIVETNRTEASYVRVKGAPEEIFRQHLARCSGIELLGGTPDEIGERLRRERNAAFHALRELGWYGPLRTVSMTG